jgi:hypothetical protein
VPTPPYEICGLGIDLGTLTPADLYGAI